MNGFFINLPLQDLIQNCPHITIEEMLQTLYDFPSLYFEFICTLWNFCLFVHTWIQLDRKY